LTILEGEVYRVLRIGSEIFQGGEAIANTSALPAVAALIVGALIAIAAVAPRHSTAAAPLIQSAPTDRADLTAPRSAPRPPRLPRDFRGRGRFIVRDLGVNVPFRWRGNDGNSVMVAGSDDDPIFFKNLIFDDTLYTITYKWPNLTEVACVAIPGFSLNQLNSALSETARFVGREILQGNPRRHVDHWRIGAVLPDIPEPGPPPPGVIRLPIALGDIYVSQSRRSRWWQVLQFGVQNQFDPELDEWFTMDTWSGQAGNVKLPEECQDPVS
jgi:hypothetical protein